MIRWSCGINQFKPQFDDFTRRRQHERGLRVIAASGFSGVELRSGTGRWEALGNPTQIARNFGSVGAFGEFVREAALEGVSSWFVDVQTGFQEDLSRPADPTDPAHRAQIVGHAEWFAEALAELGGSALVLRPAPSAGGRPALGGPDFAALADCWNAVGDAVAEHGVRLALHFDFLSVLRRDDAFEALLESTGPQVGVALDTAEFTVAGIDPVAWYRAHAERVVHVQLKNAAAVDDLDEYLEAGADQKLLRAGGSRAIPRWFLEIGTEPLLVDSPAMVNALVEHGYDGWIVAESDLSPHPATSAMLNGWEVQHRLAPIVEGAR